MGEWGRASKLIPFRIKVLNDPQRANRRLQIHTGRAVVLKSDVTKQTK